MYVHSKVNYFAYMCLESTMLCAICLYTFAVPVVHVPDYCTPSHITVSQSDAMYTCTP